MYIQVIHHYNDQVVKKKKSITSLTKMFQLANCTCEPQFPRGLCTPSPCSELELDRVRGRCCREDPWASPGFHSLFPTQDTRPGAGTTNRRQCHRALGQPPLPPKMLMMNYSPQNGEDPRCPVGRWHRKRGCRVWRRQAAKPESFGHLSTGHLRKGWLVGTASTLQILRVALKSLTEVAWVQVQCRNHFHQPSAHSQLTKAGGGRKFAGAPG